MAITKEQILEVWNGEGEAEVKAESLLKMVTEDTEEQLTNIKLVKQQIKDEKTEEIAKRHAAEEKLKTLEAENGKLQQQLKDASPENVQKIWEQKLQDAANVHASKVTELQTLIDTQKSKIDSLEVSQKMLECSEEFNKAIQGKNIAPDCLEDFKRYVLSENCSKFSRKPTGDGDATVYATKDGYTIKQVTEQALLSTFGKNCTLNQSFGGSAEGGSKKIDSKDNPFITGNITEQMRLYRTDPAKYQAYKAAAGK